MTFNKQMRLRMKLKEILVRPDVLVLMLLLAAAGRAVGQGNLVINGGFDIGTNSWTEVNISGSGWASQKGNPGGWVELDSLAPSLSTDPTISQQINGLVSGQTYTVSG